jgi:rhamnose utilization protein RhaD (predicted bifunctional aldolase and dehydrogenase)
MKNGWKKQEADAYLKKYSSTWNKDVALLAYASFLVGSVSELAMHGGGNTSCKSVFRTKSSGEISALFIKPSGADMGKVFPADFISVDLDYLKKLRFRHRLQDETISAEFRRHMLGHSVLSPSIETPMHAFLEKKFVIHTHPSAILALANRSDGEAVVNVVLGEDAGFVPYTSLGFDLGRAVASESERKSFPPGIVLAQHGLVTMGDSAEEAYKITIDCVNRAEDFLKRKRSRLLPVRSKSTIQAAVERFEKYKPLFCQFLSLQQGCPDSPTKQMKVSHLVSERVLARLDYPSASTIFCSAPLNADHLLRIKIRPVYVENPNYSNSDALRGQIEAASSLYKSDYAAYIQRHSGKLKGFVLSEYESFPRVLLLPGTGAVCAAPDDETADIYRDIIRQSMEVKSDIYETSGNYTGLSEDDAFEMELRIWQKSLARA